MFLNRVGTTQHCANTPGHPNQFQAYSQAKDILYQWLPIIVKLPYLPGVHIPSSDTYAARVREEQEIEDFLNENFTVVSEEPRAYTLVEADLLELDVDAIAHVSECRLMEPFGLARQIAEELGCNACAGRQRDTHQLRCTTASQNEPGTIRGERARNGRHVVHLYAQREHGPANNEETEMERYIWLKQCLIALGEYAQIKRLNSVAVPYHMACGNSGDDWTRYEQLIDQWAAQYSPYFEVYMAQKTKHQI